MALGHRTWPPTTSKGPQEPARAKLRLQPKEARASLGASTLSVENMNFLLAKAKGSELMPSSPETPLPALYEEHLCLKSQRRTTGGKRNNSLCFSFSLATRAGEGDCQDYCVQRNKNLTTSHTQVTTAALKGPPGNTWYHFSPLHGAFLIAMNLLNMEENMLLPLGFSFLACMDNN